MNFSAGAVARCFSRPPFDGGTRGVPDRALRETFGRKLSATEKSTLNHEKAAA